MKGDSPVDRKISLNVAGMTVFKVRRFMQLREGIYGSKESRAKAGKGSFLAWKSQQQP